MPRMGAAVAAVALAVCHPAAAMQALAQPVRAALGRGCEKAPGSTYVVAVIFAGRRDRMALTLTYLDNLVETCAVDEVHLWNATRSKEDEEWLRGTAGRPAYTVFYDSDEPWMAAYRYYSPSSPHAPVTAEGKEVPHQFTPKWEGANGENTVIVKLDDDIVYIDVAQFPCFVEYVRATPEMFLVHGNIVNNGVVAYYEAQQDPELMRRMPELAKYPQGVEQGSINGFNYTWVEYGFNGALWEDAGLAARLHKYFVEDPSRFVHKRGPHGERCIVFKSPKQRSGQGRFSINFFGARWAAWDKVALLVSSYPNQAYDEFALTAAATLVPGTTECIFPSMVVAHLSFETQKDVVDAVALPLYKTLTAKTAAEFDDAPRQAGASDC